MNATVLRSLKRQPRIVRDALLVVATALSVSAESPAQRRPAGAPSAPAPLADSVRITLLTMGQGEEVYELFGHNAIWVHEPNVHPDLVYNWGVFDFNTPGFIPRFLLGDMRYIMDYESIESTIVRYQSANRQIWAQELDLTAAEKAQLIAYIRWNAQPENREYRYNYYLDNCSTRVRDLLDRVTGGAVRAHLKSIPLDETYRWHSLRLMQGDKLLVTGVEAVLGRRTDVKLTADQTSFLPVQLMKYVRGVKLDGGTRPLVGREYVLYEANRPPEATTAPALWKGLLPIGLILGAIIIALGMSDAPGAGRRRLLATLVAFIATILGIVGLIITLLVTITDHVAAHGNENMFMLNPLWLILAVAGPMLILRGRARGTAKWVGLAATVIAVCAVLIHVVGLSRQPNWDIIGLVLPIEMAIAWVLLRRLSPTHREPQRA